MELAFLLGFKSGSVVSRLERRKTQVSLRIAFACFILFGTKPGELFPQLSDQVEGLVMSRVWDFYERIQGDSSRKNRLKIDLLEDAIARDRSRHPFQNEA